jgi:hypothetical protein
MYLRVTAFKSDPAKLDAGVAFLKDKIFPSLGKLPGYLGATCIVDREKGTGAASTLWESIEAMNKAEQAGNESREKSAEATGLDVVDVDRFEITTFEMASPTAQLPSYARLITAYGDPKNADKAAQTVRDEIVPRLKSQPGFRAFVAGINRMTGRGFTVSSWATPQQREASNAAVADMRQQISERSSLYEQQIALVETVIADVKIPAGTQVR